MNTLIESELLALIRKYFHIDKDGNITIGKNLEIDGTTKLNGGLKPILIKDGDYQTPDGTITYQVLDFGKFGNTGNHILGLIIDDECEVIGIGDYNISGTTSDKFNIYGVSMVSNDFEYVHLDNSEIGSEPIYEILAFREQCQPKLYTHTLTLTAGTTNYVLMYDCSNNTTVDSIQDLRIIMGINSTSDKVILPVVNPVDLSTAGLQVTTSICKIDAANVTAVSDNVVTKS